MSEWPRDEDGKPLAQVSMTLSEKIGLPNYSNIDVGPATVTRFVEDTAEARDQGLRECTDGCEKILAEERELVLNMINGG